MVDLAMVSEYEQLQRVYKANFSYSSLFFKYNTYCAS